MISLLLAGAVLSGIFYEYNEPLDEVNRCLAGHIDDYTNNGPTNRRLPSAVLGECRDLYVYTPPGYDPSKKYTLILWFHGAFGDETSFPRTAAIKYLDRKIQCGCCPPVVVACPDATIGGKNVLTARHSMFIDGVKGEFERHVLEEVLPFVMTNYSIRPEREAHVLSGYSGGSLPAMALGIKYRAMFSIVTIIAGPLNLRYSNCHKRYFEDFSPCTYRWSEDYFPCQQVARYYCGLIHVPAKFFVSPIFGGGKNVIDRVKVNNPADLLFSEDLQPGQLQIFIRYAGRDNFNFDAQIESFVWLARCRGIEIEAVKDPEARHTTEYCTEVQMKVYDWLCSRLLPPIEPAASEEAEVAEPETSLEPVPASE